LPQRRYRSTRLQRSREPADISIKVVVFLGAPSGDRTRVSAVKGRISRFFWFAWVSKNAENSDT
jgi:hypothetical protein